MKSICIKTNNKKIKNYLLEKLQLLETDDILFSSYRFKIYDNIIIHYLGNKLDNFIEDMSFLLANGVIEIYEKNIIFNIIQSNYFYFSNEEQFEILNKCIEEIKYDTIYNRINTIKISFCKYFLENKSLVFEGFINFRIRDYLKFIDSIIDISVNKFIIDREYEGFIKLLKEYINTKPFGANLIHLIYNKKNTTILDENDNIIKPDDTIFKANYLSDITFSSNDYALNTLLTLVPKRLVIHTEEDDEFINTLKLIFEKRVIICK